MQIVEYNASNPNIQLPRKRNWEQMTLIGISEKNILFSIYKVQYWFWAPPSEPHEHAWDLRRPQTSSVCSHKQGSASSSPPHYPSGKEPRSRSTLVSLCVWLTAPLPSLYSSPDAGVYVSVPGTLRFSIFFCHTVTFQWIPTLTPCHSR